MTEILRTTRFHDRVEIRLDDHGVAHVLLDRADKMNALDPAMYAALVDAAEHLQGLRELRAVVLSGAGRAFCAGLDMASMDNLGGGDAGQVGLADLVSRTHGPANAPQHAVWAWRTLAVPVIAALHGIAYGGGLQLALGADIQLVAADVRLAVMEMKWGLVPDMAGIALLRELVRADIARDLVFSARVVDAEEACRIGLATRLCGDPLAEALALARDIADKSPDAMRAAKRLLNLSWDHSEAALLYAESSEQQALIGAHNQCEAVAAARAKRRPKFRDPV